jgi:hypothetical protein
MADYEPVTLVDSAQTSISPYTGQSPGRPRCTRDPFTGLDTSAVPMRCLISSCLSTGWSRGGRRAVF